MRLMGKRQLGELQPYELAITMMIADLGALPMQDSRFPLLLGIIPILTLLFLKVVISYIQLKFQSSRKFMEGNPCILISEGKINYNALKKQQLNLDELMEELRLAGHFDLSQIRYAILENNGKISFLTSQEEPILPVIYVVDGKINKNSLTGGNKNKYWIEEELKKYNIDSIEKVLIAMTDTKGNFIYQLYEDYNEVDLQ